MSSIKACALTMNSYRSAGKATGSGEKPGPGKATGGGERRGPGACRQHQDSCEVSKEAKDSGKSERKEFNQLLDGLKDLFEDLANGNSECGGGGGKGAGGCRNAGQAKQSGDCGSKNPVANLEQALSAVESAKCPEKKQKALEELKKAFEQIEKSGLHIEPKLRSRLQITLSLGPGRNDGMYRGPSPISGK